MGHPGAGAGLAPRRGQPAWAKSGGVAKVCGGTAISGRRAATAWAVSLIQERAKAGLAAARARWRSGGRPKVTAAETKVVLAKKLHADKSLEIDDICQTLKMSRSTFFRYVRL
jgi:hypothetical protein